MNSVIRMDNFDDLVMVAMRRKMMMRMNFVIRTDKLGESREEAKKFLEEVEAMEREAHQVAIWHSLPLKFSQFTITQSKSQSKSQSQSQGGTPGCHMAPPPLSLKFSLCLQVSDRCMKAVKACQGFDTTRNPLR